MKKILSLVLGILTFNLAVAQSENVPDKRSSNVIFLGLLNGGSIASINYEHLFFSKSNFMIATGAGFGVGGLNALWVTQRYLVIPHYATMNIGKKEHFFELGLGGSYASSRYSNEYYIFPIIGYRLQPLEPSKVNFRVFANIPFGGYEDAEIIFSPIGLSVGLNF